MIGVTQRREGYPFGDCVQSSYATLFGLPHDAVPRFDPGALLPGETQPAREREWLSMLGLGLIEVPPGAADGLPLNEPHLISGLSPRGFGHRCVGLGGRVLWDPHPSRAGLTSIFSLGFVVPRC